MLEARAFLFTFHAQDFSSSHLVLQISLTELFVWFSVCLQRVLQSDIHVASYSYDAENEEWCEVSLQVIVAVLSINVYMSKIWLVFLWARLMSC